TVISGDTSLQFGDSATGDRAVIVRFGCDTSSSAAVVSVRAVEPGGVLRKGPVAQTESLPDVASATALGGADVAVVDYSGVVRRYRGARQTAVLDVDAVVEHGAPRVFFALHGD